MKKEKILNVPNIITSARVILLIFMWIFAINKNKTTLAILLIIALLTDIFDGTVARMIKQETKFGARFDSAIDKLIGLSIIIWIPLLIPEILNKHMIPFSLIIFFLAFSWLLAFIKFKRNPEYHLYTNKVFMGLGITIIAYLLYFGENLILIYLILAFTILKSIEEIIVTLTHKDINEDIRTIFQKKK